MSKRAPPEDDNAKTPSPESKGSGDGDTTPEQSGGPPPESATDGTPAPDSNGPESEGGGYKNPPKHSQWKKGESGNKKGRPKGSRNMATLVEKHLNRKVKITIDGERQNLSVAEALILKTLVDALNGKAGAVREAFALMREYFGPKDNDDDATKTPTTESDQATIRRALNRLNRNRNGDSNAQ